MTSLSSLLRVARSTKPSCVSRIYGSSSVSVRLAVAQERINDALGTLRMVEASRDELILAVGLTPGVAYQIADDGTVTAEISGQGLDGNGTV